MQSIDRQINSGCSVAATPEKRQQALAGVQPMCDETPSASPTQHPDLGKLWS